MLQDLPSPSDSLRDLPKESAALDGTVFDLPALDLPSGGDGGGVPEACTSTDPCPSGLRCVRGSTQYGYCAEECSDSSTCGGGECLAILPSDLTAGVCSADCDPLLDTGCPAPLHCSAEIRILTQSGDLVLTERCSEVSTAVGSPCIDNICGGGTLCVGDVCSAICDLAADNCPPGETCIVGPVEWVVDGRQLGVCS